jgi:uncharacterized membrane protein (UPF0127 family)
VKILKGKIVIAENVEVAESFGSKALGLMFRKSLPHGSAMLFIFDKPGKHGIWMPFMRFPIDIVFLDSRKRVVGLHERAKPISFRSGKTWKVYYPDEPAKYVIELPAGTVKRKKIAAGKTCCFSKRLNRSQFLE